MGCDSTSVGLACDIRVSFPTVHGSSSLPELMRFCAAEAANAPRRRDPSRASCRIPGRGMHVPNYSWVVLRLTAFPTDNLEYLCYSHPQTWLVENDLLNGF
ncbi:hypothetical protein TNIN_150871 [Trichonephila inaurata madagascariensis]|uniref:Uncharacterized protein n=1 Tax=Trichonephila inaurata madagascariensis TaxID=2747483 RepID=A0A8X6Y1F7_9ARAC|nr:hypothetical protein TNIN_150871 [Trichonephila inaurata madagascariensis]